MTKTRDIRVDKSTAAIASTLANSEREPLANAMVEVTAMEEVLWKGLPQVLNPFCKEHTGAYFYFEGKI